MKCKTKDCPAKGMDIAVDNPDNLPVICGSCGEPIYLPKEKK